MSDYSADLASATADIAEAGRPVTLIKTGTTSFDPTTSTNTPATAVETSTYAVFTEYASKDIDGEIIKTGDKKCLIAGGVDADWIQDGADRYAVINVQAVEPGEGGPILSKVQVRK